MSHSTRIRISASSALSIVGEVAMSPTQLNSDRKRDDEWGKIRVWKSRGRWGAPIDRIQPLQQLALQISASHLVLPHPLPLFASLRSYFLPTLTAASTSIWMARGKEKKTHLLSIRTLASLYSSLLSFYFYFSLPLSWIGLSPGIG